MQAEGAADEDCLETEAIMLVKYQIWPAQVR